MATKLAVAYLATSLPNNGSSIEFWVNDDGSFSIISGSAGVADYTSISRVDFYARPDPNSNPQLLAVVPCIPASSVMSLTSAGIAFSLTIRDLLGGDNIDFSATIQWNTANGDLVFAASTIVLGIAIGNNDFVNAAKPFDPNNIWARYFDNLLQLRVIDPSPRINANATISSFEAISLTNFSSQHISFQTRLVNTGSNSPLPVFCPYRGYTILSKPSDPCGWPAALFNGPFSLPVIPANDSSNSPHDSNYHVTQFPSIAWLNTTSGPLLEPVVWHFETGEFPQDQIAQFWTNRIRQPYIGGLRLINATQPLSLLPSLIWQNPAANTDTSWRIVRTARIAPDQATLALLSERLLPGGYLLALSGFPPGPVSVNGQFAAFRTHDGTPLAFTAKLPPWTTFDIEAATPQFAVHRMNFSLVLDALAPQLVRLGSLDLSFGSSLPSSNATAPSFELDFDPPLFIAQPFSEGTIWIPRVWFAGSLPVTRYAPGGQDEASSQNEFRISPNPGNSDGYAAFTRSSPIVIDAQLAIVGPPTASDTASYALMFSELTQPSPQQQQLVLTLAALPQSASATPGPAPRVLVLDREPFLVAFVSLGAATSSDDTDSTLVGVWCNLYPEGAGWRLSAGANGFSLYLPPQAVGEAMVKGFTTQDSYAPQLASATDYRFSPLLSSRLLANYFAQNAVEPGWNTRRVLGYAGQQLPGALVDGNNGGVQFELLYGMTASVTQPSLRLSELFARLGNFPGPLPNLDGPGATDPEFTSTQRGTYNDAGNAWAGLYTQLLSRPGVLELWDDQQGPDLILDDGIQYTLRTDVLYGGSGSNLLSGGIGYAVESPNIQTELTKNPRSTAAHLVSPRFTALGGFGTQRAEFANGKVIVDSRTSMGRLESMTITLVGRVGNLFNHAHHVTTYDRTVLPSDQFYLEQDLIPGRPLLRKTSEYVLITEAQRAYPESGASDPALTGFVQASNFKSTKIFVDSNWGGDVGTIGWQVPLWKPGAQPSFVYTMPHICLSVSVDPATGADAVSGEISDPEKLYFYTDTQSTTTADTDSWPVVSGIDWLDQPAYTVTGPAEYQDPSVEPGFGRFTYHFVESPAQVNVVAQRSKTAIGATLRNVSMMRGARGAGALTPTQTVNRVNDWWTAAQAHLEQAADTADQISATLQAAGDAARAKAIALGKTQDQINQAVADAEQAVVANVQATLQQSLAAVQTAYLHNGLVQDLNTLAQAPSAICNTAQTRLNSAINRLNGEQQRVVQTVLQDFPKQLLAQLNGIADTDATRFLSDVNAAIDSLTTAGQKTLIPFAGFSADTRTVIDTYATALGKYSTAINTLSTAIANHASTVQAALEAVLPGSPLRQSLDTAAADVVRVTQYMLGDRGSSIVATIDGAVDNAMTQLDAAITSGSSQVTALEGLIQSGLQSLQAIIAAATQACARADTLLTNFTPPALTTVLITLGSNLKANLASQTFTTVAAIKAAYTNYLQSNVLGPANDAATWAAQQVQSQESWIQQNAASLCQTLSLDLSKLMGQLSNFATNELTSLLQNCIGDTAQFRSALETMGSQVASQLQHVTQGLTQEAQAVVTGATGAALQVIRAFGEPPHVPTMSFVAQQLPTFPLPTMAFDFLGALPTVNMTPALAVATQLANGLGSLSQLSVSLPTSSLLDRLVPDSLENFDLRSILPSFAGLDLSALFSGVGMPSIADNTIRITHHIDPQTRRASLDADILVPLAGETSILDLGPVTLLLDNAQFEAQVHSEVTVGQQITQTSSGQITGNWNLLICGVSIVSFTQTTLNFDSSGHLHFSIVPANVRLTAILQFLADIVNSFTFGDSGFSIHMTPTPLSVQCILDLPLPDMAAGAFGIMNLDFGAMFEVGIDNNGFYLGVGANLGRKTAPFVLTVFILGGAGWMEANLRYQNGLATGEITIGMAASAAIEIALGPISGSVSIQFGIFVEFSIGSGGGLQLGIMILVVGRVSLCGIIDANITLLLEAEYSSGGGLVGRGYVSVTIKICWCFTFSVHAGVQYGFGNASKQQPAVQSPAAVPQAPSIGAAAAMPTAAAPASPFNDYKQAALDYVDMLA
jgi:hypothetical protein